MDDGRKERERKKTRIGRSMDADRAVSGLARSSIASRERVTRARVSARSSNSGDNAGSPLKYSTARFTNDELVGPKTPLRVAVLRWGLRGRSNEYRGHRFAGGVAASGLLQRRRAEPDHLVRHRAEGAAQEAQAVRGHRIRATCHHEAGCWGSR